jgi:hypothetical protein
MIQSPQSNEQTLFNVIYLTLAGVDDLTRQRICFFSISISSRPVNHLFSFSQLCIMSLLLRRKKLITFLNNYLSQNEKQSLIIKSQSKYFTFYESK